MLFVDCNTESKREWLEAIRHAIGLDTGNKIVDPEGDHALRRLLFRLVTDYKAGSTFW